jgi:hypothetical protein
MGNSFRELSAISYQPSVKPCYSEPARRRRAGEGSLCLDIAKPIVSPIAIPIANHAPPVPRAMEIAVPIPATSAIPKPICIDGRFIFKLRQVPSLRNSINFVCLPRAYALGYLNAAPSGLDQVMRKSFCRSPYAIQNLEKYFHDAEQ